MGTGGHNRAFGEGMLSSFADKPLEDLHRQQASRHQTKVMPGRSPQRLQTGQSQCLCLSAFPELISSSFFPACPPASLPACLSPQCLLCLPACLPDQTRLNTNSFYPTVHLPTVQYLPYLPTPGTVLYCRGWTDY